MSEAQDLLAAVQDTVVEHQVQRAIQTQAPCPHCGRARRHKDTRQIVVRTLFGVLRLSSPRWWHCDCRAQPSRTFQPLAARLEDELGEEQFSFIDTCQADRDELPCPDLPLTVRLDGGYVHSSAQRSLGQRADRPGSKRVERPDVCDLPTRRTSADGHRRRRHVRAVRGPAQPSGLRPLRAGQTGRRRAEVTVHGRCLQIGSGLCFPVRHCQR